MARALQPESYQKSKTTLHLVLLFPVFDQSRRQGKYPRSILEVSLQKEKTTPTQASKDLEGSRRFTPRISTQSANEVGKVVSPTHRPPLPLRRYSWYSFMLEAESNLGP
jgi:hypothetical protein